MSETFAELFEQSLNDIDMTPGAIVEATVVSIEPDFVIVNAGLKSEGAIPKSQFYSEGGELSVAVGDSVKVALDAVEDGFGATRLSREKAKRAEAWIDLEKAHEDNAV
jgi:Ribosomal protein S1